MRVTYRLFGLPIWSVEYEVDDEDLEDSTEDDDDEAGSDIPVIIQSQAERAHTEPPMFGFVDHKDTPVWDVTHNTPRSLFPNQPTNH